MHNRKHLAVLAALCFSFSACQVDRIEIPEEELFTREFIKSFGIISSDQDWSVLKRASVKVSVPGTTDVRILAQVDGKTQLLAHYSGVSGSRELEFDCPKQTEYVLVKTPANFERVPLGGEFRVGAPSRAIDGDDNILGYTIEDGYYWGNKYVHGIYRKLPEGDARNMVDAEIVADFSFISTGKPFVFYPIYWQTGGDDILGVYWYENGEMKTKDLFSNKTTVKGEDGEEIKYHNIYRRTTLGSDLGITSRIPADGAVDQPTDGVIILDFNRQVKIRASHQATISSGTLSVPALSEDNMSVTYVYSGATPGTEVTFWVNGGSFEAIDNTEGDLKTAMNQTYSYKFTIKDTPRSRWTAVTYESSSYDVSAGVVGTITMTFDSDVSIGTGNVTLTAESGDAAVVGTASVSGKTVTMPYSGASLDTSYTIAIPDGFLKGTDGRNVILEGFEKNGKNVMKTPGRKYDEAVNAEFSVTYDKDGKVLTESGTSVVKSAEIVDAVILYPEANKGNVKVTTDGVGSLSYDVIGSANTTILSPVFGLRTKVSKSVSGVVSESNIDGTGYAILGIQPKQDLMFTVYAFRAGNDGDKPNYPQIWDNDNECQVENRYHSYANCDVDVKGKTEIWTKYTITALLRKDGNYMLFANPGSQGCICGLSYQLPTDEVEFGSVTYTNDIGVTNVRSRASSDGGDSGLGTNGKIPDFYLNGETPESHDFVRSDGTQSKAILENDEVLTHRISFTLKEGVIFGFYLRNESGANNITNHDGIIVPHTSYSLSSLNQEMPNTLFNNLSGSSASKYFTKGWGTSNPGGPDGEYHGKLNGKDGKRVEVPENRKYSTASTYTVRINGQEMRYFSFEDWVDYDFNDIAFMVAPESTDTEIVDNEVDTNPYIYAVEDLGATTTSDIDFNDIVFAVEHVSGSDAAFVTMLAAGGTLKAHLYYKGLEIGNGFGEIVAGPHVGTDKALGHVNDWFGVDTHNVTVNVGGGVQTGFGALTTVRIPVEEDFSLVGKLEGDISRENGFFVEIEREDGRTTQITRPDHKGEAPQMIILPGTWHWPLERVAISEAYPGGINYDGTYLPSFQEWVTKGDGFGFQSIDWYKTAKDGTVMRHAWNGSEAARDYYSKQNN